MKIRMIKCMIAIFILIDCTFGGVNCIAMNKNIRRIEPFAVDICKKYVSGSSSSKLSKEYGCADISILALLRRHDIEVRGRKEAFSLKAIPVNHDFFSVIDTELKAYLLGIMFSDGQVHSKRPEIALELTDLDVITLFRDSLGKDLKILVRKKKDVSNRQGYLVRMTSNQLKSDLIKHGCTPRKSLTLKYPTTVPQHLERHFIRGYFDGDGCICVTEKTKRASMVGTYDMLYKIKVVLNLHSINCGKKILDAHVLEVGKTFDIRIDCLSLRNFKKFLYDGSEFYMKRKFNKFKLI